ncbi:hypothetical protein [Polaromonas sp. YR568]|uniref:hypothetical protein n=1 Tax=Polaromonas sp. YR568 TaxID=1855301 RepID=UPI0031379031
MSQPSPAPSNDAKKSATPLERALDKNEAVKETVEQSAAELVIVNAVLNQELPDHVQTGDVAQALQKTSELETRIQDSAEELHQVNEALAQEIDERTQLEGKLAKTEAALAKATGKPAP